MTVATNRMSEIERHTVSHTHHYTPLSPESFEEDDVELSKSLCYYFDQLLLLIKLSYGLDYELLKDSYIDEYMFIFILDIKINIYS